MAIGVGLARLDASFGTYESFVPEVDLPIEDERYPRLSLIDPYDSLSFTSYQAEAMLPDFERLVEARPDTAPVLDLVRRCASEKIWVLWFMGD